MNIPENLIKLRSGTSLQGYVTVRYKQLVELFGEPHPNPDNHKTDVEWILSTPYGVVTIYNYKNGTTYLGSPGVEIMSMHEWHVGAKNKESYEWVVTYINS